MFQPLSEADVYLASETLVYTILEADSDNPHIKYHTSFMDLFLENNVGKKKV